MSNSRDDLVDRAVGIQADFTTFYEILIRFQDEVQDWIKDNEASCDLAELADVGGIMRNLEKNLDEARKDIKSQVSLISTKLAVLVTKRHVMDPTTQLKARGAHYIAYPNVEVVPKVPKWPSNEFSAACEMLKIPEAATESGIIQFHFPRLADWLTKRHIEGKQDLPVFGKLRTKAKATYRKVKSDE